MHFTVLDWTIVLIYLGLSITAGLYGKKYISSVSDFLVAGRKLGPFLGIATLAATETGTLTFMYYAQLGFQTGFSSFVIGLITGIVMIVIGRTGFIVKRLRAMRLMTIPEFMEVRYGTGVRILTGILAATGGILNMGIFLKLEGTFLAIISGIPLHYLKATMAGILVLELLYTVLGGMVSIVITDFIQYVAMSLGTVLVTIWAIHIAGWGHMSHAVSISMGAAGFSPILNPRYGWAYIMFQALQALAVDTCWQTTAMRTFSTQSPEVSKKVFSWTGFVYLGRGMMPMLWGIGALTMLGPHVDSLSAMPIFLSKILPTGILGLVVAGMLAATMSVNSSYLLGWSSIIAQDIVQPLRRKPLSSRSQLVLNRVCNVFVSLFVLYWGLWYTLPGPAYFYLVVTSSIFLAGALATVVGGLFWKRANAVGGYCAFLAGCTGSIGFFFFHLSAAHAGLGSFLLGGIGLIVGTILGERRPFKQRGISNSVPTPGT